MRVFPEAILERGQHGWTWDGRDSNGAQLGPGIYFYAFRSANARLSGKIMVAP